MSASPVSGGPAFPHECKRPDVATLDHALGHSPNPIRQMVNRVCLTCLTHWYGDAGVAVFEMPRRVWDAWTESGLATREGATHEG